VPRSSPLIRTQPTTLTAAISRSESYTVTSTGGWAGYIPDLRSAAYGGYGADVSTSIEVGAGGKIMLRHLTSLYELKGMWFDRPGRR
jgi:hypothetical protein